MNALSRYALQSVGVAAFVLALKWLAAALTGSVALWSDALESIINVVVAAVAYFALRLSAKGADANHQFGHYKVEYFSAVLEGALIAVAALAIFREATASFFDPKPLDAPILGLAINGVATVINAGWGWHLTRIGRRERSPALYADGQHVLSDVISSLGVILGLIAAVLTGWLWLDAVIAAFVGAYILTTGWRLVKHSIGGLMDAAADSETLAAIKTTIGTEANGALEAHDLRTRAAGPVTFIEFHLVVPASMTVSTAHDICDRIESALMRVVPGARVTIHVEPEDKAKHAGVSMRSSHA
ncbi:cation diffusion facilitator family transporter [Rhodomicrobium sp. Az07]|uniref:cation diffusion facilitator family transporter n=1 Tax=Rhodomicrobium sp. Az07 TaxID=2839034 RepID=UPI001BE5F520|nr:cation diffusion facilitator family transporter [Rhodomicrobium sp. Az07]MBT3069954.1 cation diffusion facilitator family transporter [Rhodomicrobium sp. Az07]